MNSKPWLDADALHRERLADHRQGQPMFYESGPGAVNELNRRNRELLAANARLHAQIELMKKQLREFERHHKGAEKHV